MSESRMGGNSWTVAEVSLLQSMVGQTFEAVVRTFEDAYANHTYRDGFGTLRNAYGIKRKLANMGFYLVNNVMRSRDALPEKTDIYRRARTPQLQRIQEVQEHYKESTMHRTRGSVTNLHAKKILSLSDIHFPFAMYDMLEQAIETHADADAVVVNGDMLEGYAFSRYQKDKRVQAVDEYLCAFEFVEMLSKKFPKVYLVDGNHDVRTSRHMVDSGTPDEMARLLRPNILARIANGERLDEEGNLIEKITFTNVVYDPQESWYILLGKTIFAHPHGRGGKNPGLMVERVMNYFNSRYDQGDFDSVIIGHTHKLYKGVIGGKLLIEQGCLCDSMAYMHSAKLDYINNGMNGYGLIYQDDEGNTDFNESGFVFCGEVMPPKKQVTL